MKNLLTLIILIALSSCALLDRKHDMAVKITNLESLKAVKSQAPRLTRSDKYKSCIIELSREGIKQSLLGTLCDGVYGSIE